MAPADIGNTPRVLDSSDAGVVGRAGLPSVRVGSALRAPRRHERAAGPVSDLGDAAQHAARAARPVGGARAVHGAAHGGRQNVHAAAHGEDGSARENAGGGASRQSMRWRSRCSTRSSDDSAIMTQARRGARISLRAARQNATAARNDALLAAITAFEDSVVGDRRGREAAADVAAAVAADAAAARRTGPTIALDQRRAVAADAAARGGRRRADDAGACRRCATRSAIRRRSSRGGMRFGRG